MKTKGIKGLHQIAKSRAAGLSMPDTTALGEDIKIVLSLDPLADKVNVRELLKVIEEQKIITEADVIMYKGLE